MIYDVAIIGAGPVGIFSIFACGMQGLKCAIIDGLSELGGQCRCVYPQKNIYDVPGFFEITGAQLVEKLVAQAMVFEPDIFLNSFVQSIDQIDNLFSLKLMDKSILAKSIIIASGAGKFSPMRPNLEHVLEQENKSVFYFIDDLSIFADKKVAIAGGGDSALDWVIDLSKIASKVYLIHRRDYIKAHPASWEKVQALSKNGKVEIKIPYTIEGLNVQDDKLIGLNIKNNDEELIEIDYFVPCFGLKSDSTFLSGWNLQLFHNKIVVEPTTMRTSCAGIYAIGDCVHYYNKRKLILTGFSEASQAASDIFSYIYPDKAPIIGHSTSLGVPKHFHNN